MIFMIPGTPKDLLCYFAGLTDIKFPVFLLVCSLGRLPSVVTSTVGGDALGTQDYLFAVVVFLVTFLISVGGLLCYRQICKRHNTRKEGADGRKRRGKISGHKPLFYAIMGSNQNLWSCSSAGLEVPRMLLGKNFGPRSKTRALRRRRI